MKNIVFLSTFVFLLGLLFPPSIQARPTEITSAPIAEVVVPAKPKKVRKKYRKKRKRIKQEQVRLEFIVYFIPILLIAGAVLFIVGLSIPLFALWLAGLILFGIVNISMTALFVIAKLSLDKSRDRGLGAVILAIVLLVLGAINLVFGLIFLIWGLIAALPIMWIVGLVCLVFMALCIFAIASNN